MRKPTFEEISDFMEYRANHVALVQKLGRAALDMDFSDHDRDKIEATGKDLELLALRYLDKKGKIRTSKEDKNTLRKVSARHAKNSKHHAEYWDPSINMRNFNAEDENIIHASNMPRRYLAEMACDWAACALYHNEPIFKWFNKSIGTTLFLTDGQIEYLKNCLDSIYRCISKEGICFPGRKYTAQQIPPRITDERKMKEGVTKEEAQSVLEDEVLKNRNLFLKTFKSNKKGNVNVFSGIVRPTDDRGRKAHKEDIVDIDDTPDEDVDKDGKYHLVSTESINLDRSRSIGAPFNSSEVSNTTPMALLNFSNPDEDSYFEVVLGFKNKPGTGSAPPTEVTEPLAAEALCAQINTGDCSYMMKKEVPELKNSAVEEWLRVSMSTARRISDSDYICKNARYVVCRMNRIFHEKDGRVEVTSEFQGKPSIHLLINSLISRRKDLFTSTSKDSWNPSDIYLVKESEYSRIYDEWDNLMNDNSIVTKSQYNSILQGYALGNGNEGRDLVGVSLKKLEPGSEGTLIPVNYSQNYSSTSEDISPFIEEPSSIKIPNMEVLPMDSEKTIGAGIYFNCNTRDNHDGYDHIAYSYRVFNTTSTSPHMELIGSPSSARLGKTPSSLMTDFKSENGLDMEWNNMEDGNSMDLRISKNYHRWALAQVRNLLSDDMMRKISFIERNLKVVDAKGTSLSQDTWRKYVNELEKVNYLMIAADEEKKDSEKNLRSLEIIRWPKLIDMLFAFAVSRSKGKDNFENDLSRIYNWSKKEGLEFAPYLLIH